MLASRRPAIVLAAQTRRFVRGRTCLVDTPYQDPDTVIMAYYLRCHVSQVSDPSVAAAHAERSGWATISILGTRRPRGSYAFISEQGWARHRLHGAGGLRYVFVAPRDAASLAPGG
jgi:hypothetical protein